MAGTPQSKWFSSQDEIFSYTEWIIYCTLFNKHLRCLKIGAHGEMREQIHVWCLTEKWPQTFCCLHRIQSLWLNSTCWAYWLKTQLNKLVPQLFFFKCLTVDVLTVFDLPYILSFIYNGTRLESHNYSSIDLQPTFILTLGTNAMNTNPDDDYEICH